MRIGVVGIVHVRVGGYEGFFQTLRSPLKSVHVSDTFFSYTSSCTNDINTTAPRTKDTASMQHEASVFHVKNRGNSQPVQLMSAYYYWHAKFETQSLTLVTQTRSHRHPTRHNQPCSLGGKDGLLLLAVKQSNVWQLIYTEKGNLCSTPSAFSCPITLHEQQSKSMCQLASSLLEEACASFHLPSLIAGNQPRLNWVKNHKWLTQMNEQIL